MKENNSKHKAKIKIVEQRWHGKSKEGSQILPKETVVEKKSGSFLSIQESKYKTGFWAEDNQDTENMQNISYKQKEGFRLFISSNSSEQVAFTPEVRMEPIEGSEFPVRWTLPLEKTILNVGDTFEIKPHTMDAGVTYTVTLLEIVE